MRNVTIVESNVEPNKEHLWFYKGELKWFSPNGWEGVNKSSPTISPTSTKPLIAYIIFKSDAVSNAVINGERIPMNTPKAVIIDYYYSLTALTVPGRKFIGFYENEVKISSAEIIRYHVLPGVHNIELRYKRENEDLDSTTASTPQPGTTTTTSTPIPTTTTSTTPIPNSIRFTNKTNTSLSLSQVNAGNGASVSPPILSDGTHILGLFSNDAYILVEPSQIPFNHLKITAFNAAGESLNVSYESEVQSNGSTWYKFSFKELIDNGVTSVTIEGYVVRVYNEIYPDTTLAIAITHNHLNNFSPSEIHYSCDFGSTINIEPPTSTEKYLAVIRPKTSNSKDTIVAEIMFDGGYDGQYSLYPIETTEDESSKYFLFDLSTRISDIPSIALISLYDYNSHTISTIPPFVDGNTPPFADEK